MRGILSGLCRAGSTSPAVPAFVFVSALVLGTLPATGQELGVTLLEVLRMAAAGSPIVREEAARVASAEAAVLSARTYPHNPTLKARVARRDIQSGNDRQDWGLALSQRIEIGGQRRLHVTSTRAELAAARYRLKRVQRELAARGALAFADAVEQRKLMEVAAADLALARLFSELISRRFQAGAANQIEANRAPSRVGRAAVEHAKIAAGYAAARAELAAAVGDPEARLLTPRGDLPLPRVPDEEQVVGSFEESLRPLERSFEAGKIGTGELLALRRELVEARRSHVSFLAKAWRSALLLALALGDDPAGLMLTRGANSDEEASS